MWQTLEDLIKTRLPQLLVRYIGVALVWIAAKVHATADDATIQGASTWVALIVVAGLCFIIDHFVMHPATTQAAIDAAPNDPAPAPVAPVK